MAFLVFEGIDGAGKSTLIRAVEEQLKKHQTPYELVRDPGGTSVGEKLRALILDPKEKPCARTEILMYQASRAQLVEEVIRPHLQKKNWVLSDRFYTSTVAFQCWARGISAEQVNWLNDYACGGLKPDLVVYIDITVEESQRRQSKRNENAGTEKDRIENENSTFHEKVRQGYLAQAKLFPQSWLVLDGLKSPETLQQEVLQTLQERGWLS